MRDTLTFFAAMFAITALAEFALLRRCYGRRNTWACILSVAAISGVAWMAFAALLGWIQYGWKAADEPPISGWDWLPISLLVVMDTLILAVIALFPAWLVALIYRRMKSIA